MKNKRTYSATAALALALSGCAGFGGTTPSAANPAPQALHAGAPPSVDGVAGLYQGTVHDGVLGKGTAVVELSQTGTSVGGSMTEKFGKLTLQSIVAMTASPTDTAGGTFVVTEKPCSFTITGKYDKKTLMLTGKYKGFNGCTQSGTFAVKEQCYYNVAAPKGAAIEQRTVPMRC